MNLRNLRQARHALVPIALALLAGCSLSDLPHGNLVGIPNSDQSQFNGKDYTDPNPHSASDDAQRPAYQQHQQEQINAASKPAMPDIGSMTCASTGTTATAANAGSFVGSTNCHN